VDIAKRLKYYQLRSDAMKGTNPCHLSLCFVPNSRFINRFQSLGLPAFTHCMLRKIAEVNVYPQFAREAWGKGQSRRFSRAHFVLEPELSQHVLLRASMRYANQLCVTQTKLACYQTLIQSRVSSQACSCVTGCCSQQNGIRTFIC